ncbi:MAG: FAD-dependent thymidylate synthase [Spirochaetales bacterium]|nr:FAD-dependent thymidylate synthase [Spirochaetales bacterium]
MARCTVAAAEEILDQQFPVLDKGFVRLVDYMGSDDRIVQAARVSYGKGTKTARQDAGLIDYLLRNGHTSPFEQVVFTFHAKMPVFVARQWIRHRTARLNEVSARYSVMADEFYVPELADVSVQSTDNKQGRRDEPMSPEEAQIIRDSIEAVNQKAYADYGKMLEAGTARELARVVLPVSMYTEWYWQIDLHNLFHFLRLRLDAHAQREIRAYAEVMRDLARRVCPAAFASFDRHLAGGVRFSSEEMEALRSMLDGEDHGLEGRDAQRFEAKITQGRQL